MMYGGSLERSCRYETDLNRWLLSERIQALAIEADNANGGLIETHTAYQRRLDAKLLASDKELFEPNRSTEAFYPDNILNTKPPATDT